MSCLGLVDAYRGGGDPSMPFAYRAVWACYENRAFGDRCCGVVPQEEVTRETGVTRSTVGLATAYLEQKGIIGVERRHRQPSIIRMLRTYQLANPVHENQAQSPPVSVGKSCTSEFSDRKSGPNPPDLVHENHAPLYPLESKKESTRESTRAPVSPDQNLDSDEPVARRVLETWNGVAEVAGLEPEPINDLRELQVAGWLRGQNLDDVIAALAKVRDTPFLRGEVTGFKTTFQWLMRPGKVAHVLRQDYGQFEVKPRKTPWQQKQSDHAESQAELNALWARMRAEREAREGVAA